MAQSSELQQRASHSGLLSAVSQGQPPSTALELSSVLERFSDNYTLSMRSAVPGAARPVCFPPREQESAWLNILCRLSCARA